MAVDINALRARLGVQSNTATKPQGDNHELSSPNSNSNGINSTNNPSSDSTANTASPSNSSTPTQQVETPAATNTRFLATLQKAKEQIMQDPQLAESEKLQKEIEVSELLTKMEELDVRIKAKHPLMPTLLREIHTTLRKQPDNVTLLDEEQIAIVVSGLILQTNTTIATKKATSKKSTKGITIDDL